MRETDREPAQEVFLSMSNQRYAVLLRRALTRSGRGRRTTHHTCPPWAAQGPQPIGTNLSGQRPTPRLTARVNPTLRRISPPSSWRRSAGFAPVLGWCGQPSLNPEVGAHGRPQGIAHAHQLKQVAAWAPPQVDRKWPRPRLTARVNPTLHDAMRRIEHAGERGPSIVGLT